MADTWVRAWPRRDAEAIAALYADTVVNRSPAFRPPDLGLAGVRRYLSEQLPVKEDIECWFGQPIVSGDRAAVEWWASCTEQGHELTYAGVTVLYFDDQGQAGIQGCAGNARFRTIVNRPSSASTRPTEIPQVRAAAAFPTGFPQTKRHSPAHGGTPAKVAP